MSRRSPPEHELQEPRAAPEIGEEREARAGESRRAQGQKPARMARRPVRRARRLRLAAHGVEPGRLMVEGGAEADADQREDDRRHDQLRLPLEAEKGAQREAGARRAAAVGGLGDHVFEAENRIAGDAERGHRRLDAAALARRIGVDLRAGRLVEQRFAELCAARVRLLERAALGLELQPCGVEPLEGRARTRRRDRARRGSPRPRRPARRSRAAYEAPAPARRRARPSSSAASMRTVAMGLSERRGTASGRRCREALDGADELVEGDAFAASGRPEQADGERRLRARMARELGQKVERRVDPERAGGEQRRDRRRRRRRKSARRRCVGCAEPGGGALGGRGRPRRRRLLRARSARRE